MEGVESADQVFADVPHADSSDLAKPLPPEGKEGPPPPTVLGGISHEILARITVVSRSLS